MGANATVVEEAYSAFSRGDIPAVLDKLDENVEWSSPATLPQGGRFHGKDGVVKFFEGVGGAWDPLGLAVESVGELGPELVVGVLRADGTRRAGKPSGYGAVHVFTVHDGKITRFREYTDLDRPLD
jgi:ketosteroid isomerase-like protein